MMTKILAGNFLSTIINMFNSEQYDNLAVISAEADDQSLVLFLAKEEQKNRNVKQKRKRPKRIKKERKKNKIDRESWDWMNNNGSMVISFLGQENISRGEICYVSRVVIVILFPFLLYIIVLSYRQLCLPFVLHIGVCGRLLGCI